VLIALGGKSILFAIIF